MVTTLEECESGMELPGKQAPRAAAPVPRFYACGAGGRKTSGREGQEGGERRKSEPELHAELHLIGFWQHTGYGLACQAPIARVFEP